MTAIGVLHPGDMGSGIGAVLTGAGHDVRWCPVGRSAATAQRAAGAGLQPVPTLAGLADSVDLIISVCPPAFAADVAASVGKSGFAGLYVDANAISPERVRSLAPLLPQASLVDGSIIGPPPPGPTRLHLSGERAHEVAAVFAGTAVTVALLDGDVGAASALKMAYASWSKGSTALAANAQALARAFGVEEALLAEWSAGSGRPVSEATLQRAAAAGWRWEGEMEEIAASCAAVGLPPETFAGIAAVFARWSERRDDRSVPVDALLDDLLGGQSAG